MTSTSPHTPPPQIATTLCAGPMVEFDYGGMSHVVPTASASSIGQRSDMWPSPFSFTANFFFFFPFPEGVYSYTCLWFWNCQPIVDVMRDVQDQPCSCWGLDQALSWFSASRGLLTMPEQVRLTYGEAPGDGVVALSFGYADGIFQPFKKPSPIFVSSQDRARNPEAKHYTVSGRIQS